MNITETKIPSTKGNLAAAIHYPEKKNDKLAIICPGYLDSKDYKHLISLAEVLSKQGYTVVRFDPTGTWESEGDISNYTTTQYLTDVKSVLEYMLHEGNYKHILLGGHSKGGFIAMLYAPRDPRISTVLGIMSPYSISRPSNKEKLENWKDGYKTSLRDIPNQTGKKEFRVPYAYVVDRLRYNVLKEINKFRGLLILVAGELDETVLPNEVKEIYNNANEPKKFLVIPNIGHNYRHNDSEVKIVNEKILEQLNSIKL